MGTFSGFYSRKDVIDTLIIQYTNDHFRIIDRKVTKWGRHLWMLLQPKHGPSFIRLFKLSSYKGDWGYKPIDESMGPYACECPVSLLDQADPPPNQYAAEWRARVRWLHST